MPKESYKNLRRERRARCWRECIRQLAAGRTVTCIAGRRGLRHIGIKTSDSLEARGGPAMDHAYVDKPRDSEIGPTASDVVLVQGSPRI